MAPSKMDLDELKGIIASEMRVALGFDGDPTGRSRTRLLELYEGSPLGNTDDPFRCRIVARNVLEGVEWSLAALLRIFTASDKIFDFQPTRSDAENTAKQATDYVNFVFMRDCKGPSILNMALKTSLIQRNSYLLIHWVEERSYQYNIYTGLSQEQFEALTKDDDVEVIDDVEYPNPDPTWSWVQQDAAQPGVTLAGPQAGQPAPPMLHDIRTKTWNTNGRVRVEHIPPEEIFVSPMTTDVQLDRAPFVCRKALKTVSQLREMGFDDELILDAAAPQEAPSTEAAARYWELGGYPNTIRTDEAMRTVMLEESFVRVDYDGDGIAELRHIYSARNGSIVFENEEVDEIPIVSLCPLPMPFRHQGMSMADMLVDLQESSTFVIQQTMDSLSIATTPRLAMNELTMSENTFDDLNQDGPGALLRYRGDAPPTTLNIPFVGSESLQVLQFINESQAQRTGISSQNNGISPDDLNTTATGIALKQNAANQRLEYMARVYADQIAEIGTHILGLLTRHQSEARAVRVTGDMFVPFDPRNWHESYDVTCVAGLGTGDKSQIQTTMNNIMAIQKTMIEGGLIGKTVTLDNVFNAAKRFVEASGYKNEEEFFTNPATAPQQPTPQKPDPEMMKVQAQAQLDQQRLSANLAMKQKEFEFDQAQKTQDFQFQRAQQQQDFEHKWMLEDRDAAHQLELETRRENFKAQQEMLRTQRAQQPVAPGIPT